MLFRFQFNYWTYIFSAKVWPVNTLHKMRIKFRNKVSPWAQRIVNGLSSQSVPKTTTLISNTIKTQFNFSRVFPFYWLYSQVVTITIELFSYFLIFSSFFFDLVSVIYRTIVSKIQITLKCKLEQINCLFFG